MTTSSDWILWDFPLSYHFLTQTDLSTLDNILCLCAECSLNGDEVAKMILVVLSTLISVFINTAAGCHSFGSVNMLLHDKKDRQFSQNVVGCITRTSFENTTVVKVFVANQSIPKFGRDTVKHMKYLTTISINKCDVQEISPGAFRNVPSLTNVEVAYGKLKTIPKGIFSHDLTPKLEFFKADHNEIASIDDQAFYDLPDLKYIHLNNNKLESWNSDWFNQSTSLEVINLRFNSLHRIPNRAFANFQKLKKIIFDHNDIHTIQPDAFKGIRSLEYLGLSHNKLFVISEKGFPNTLRIQYFTINANYLSFISQKVLKQLAAVRIVMDFNPWTCPCLSDINYWLFIKNGKVDVLDKCNINNVPVCIAPKKLEVCSEETDQDAVLKYVNTIKAINMSTPIPRDCVDELMFSQNFLSPSL